MGAKTRRAINRLLSEDDTRTDAERGRWVRCYLEIELSLLPSCLILRDAAAIVLGYLELMECYEPGQFPWYRVNQILRAMLEASSGATRKEVIIPPMEISQAA